MPTVRLLRAAITAFHPDDPTAWDPSPESVRCDAGSVRFRIQPADDPSRFEIVHEAQGRRWGSRFSDALHTIATILPQPRFGMIAIPRPSPEERAAALVSLRACVPAMDAVTIQSALRTSATACSLRCRQARRLTEFRRRARRTGLLRLRPSASLDTVVGACRAIHSASGVGNDPSPVGMTIGDIVTVRRRPVSFSARIIGNAASTPWVDACVTLASAFRVRAPFRLLGSDTNLIEKAEPPRSGHERMANEAALLRLLDRLGDVGGLRDLLCQDLAATDSADRAAQATHYELDITTRRVQMERVPQR